MFENEHLDDGSGFTAPQIMLKLDFESGTRVPRLFFIPVESVEEDGYVTGGDEEVVLELKGLPESMAGELRKLLGTNMWFLSRDEPEVDDHLEQQIRESLKRGCEDG